VPTQLDAVTTAAMRSRRPLDDVPATVSVITTENIDRENMQDIRDLVRNEPGVTVGNNPNRAGFQNFVIRGIGGNRVLLMVDGMRTPDFPDSNQGAGTYSREQPDLEDIRRVEIIRGPASALYGSDAIGGVVAYTTKDPGDYMRDGKDVYASAKAAYSGANLQFSESFTGAVRSGTDRNIGGLDNFFTYGASFSWTTTTRPRNRTQITLATGATTNSVGGELYPNKNFPDTDTVQAGIYVQDEISALGGRLKITPAVRLDYYSMTPNPDKYFWNSTGATLNAVPSATTYVSASPKLGLLYHFNDTYSGYFQYATGFRAPPYDNANFGFTNAASFYQILPNANLKPETANSFEVGFRGKYENGSSWQLTGFYNLYNNFLETAVVSMVGPVTQYQYVNLTNVTIWGIEARGEYRFAPEWAVAGWTAFAQGTDTRTGLPVDSVSPWTTQARIRYGFDKGIVAQLIGTAAAAHTQVSSPNYFQAPAYFTLDATVGYVFNEHFKFNAGAFNITNAKYWNAPDTIGISPTNPQLDLYAQPGRYFGVNLLAKW
jgi:hemoglobin/transferrin/lactoferrin receptor protein